MKKFALLIGLDYPGTNNQLSGCVEDALRIKDYLKSSLGFIDNEITLLIDKDRRSGGPLDASKRITKKVILDEFKRIVNTSVCGDFVFIHYSGHGTQVKSLDKDETDGKDEAIVVNEKELITDDEFRSMLSNFKLGVKCFTLMDCCHSGSIYDLKYTIRPKTAYQYKLLTFLNKTAVSDSKSDYEFVVEGPYSETNADIIMLSGCRDPEVSLECSGKGVLTTSFLVVMKLNNNKLTRFELIKKIRTYIAKNKLSDQKPMLSSGRENNLDLLVIPY